MYVVVLFFVIFVYVGDLLQLGASAVFRFNNPQEAAKLRKRQSVSQTPGLAEVVLILIPQVVALRS